MGTTNGPFSIAMQQITRGYVRICPWMVEHKPGEHHILDPKKCVEHPPFHQIYPVESPRITPFRLVCK